MEVKMDLEKEFYNRIAMSNEKQKQIDSLLEEKKLWEDSAYRLLVDNNFVEEYSQHMLDMICAILSSQADHSSSNYSKDDIEMAHYVVDDIKEKVFGEDENIVFAEIQPYLGVGYSVQYQNKIDNTCWMIQLPNYMFIYKNAHRTPSDVLYKLAKKSHDFVWDTICEAWTLCGLGKEYKQLKTK